MAVLLSKKEVSERAHPEAGVTMSGNPQRWAATYLDAFYGSRDLIAEVSPIASRLISAKGTTLLESRIRGETAGVMALYRTPQVIGVYCLGTSPGHRGRGVATGLLTEARRVAKEEGRNLILQTLRSDGAGRFYRDRGFSELYSKRFLERRLNVQPRRRP